METTLQSKSEYKQVTNSALLERHLQHIKRHATKGEVKEIKDHQKAIFTMRTDLLLPLIEKFKTEVSIDGISG